jgi:hypothetical protein
MNRAELVSESGAQEIRIRKYFSNPECFLELVRQIIESERQEPIVLYIHDETKPQDLE